MSDEVARARERRIDRDHVSMDVPNCPACLHQLTPDADAERWICRQPDCVNNDVRTL
ncbi:MULTISPECIES: hypothetical protein [Microbacterium]|jgi:hypothetical protein|uniref:hypothetical protein n=1 Tax=Microbacterium flavum TaxID=415216 RepID=UPI0024AE4BF0|nr:hypothetical protein [Microbacterium flavum]